MEFIIVLLIVAFIVLYRKSNGESLYKFVTTSIGNVYDKYAPYTLNLENELNSALGEVNKKLYYDALIPYVE